MATTEQFSLRWNNFHSNITSGFHDLLEASDLVDVTLAVEGQFLHAHKLVLSICSPYFKQMFKINPCKHPIIILKDVTHDNLRDILEFMYLGEVNVLRENLPIFLQTAELLQVKGLSCDDTQSNSSKSSKNIDNKLDSFDDSLMEDEFLEENNRFSNQQLPTMTTSTCKRGRNPTAQSNPKKSKNDNDMPSNKNQIVAKEESDLFEITNTVINEPSVEIDNTQYDTDELQTGKPNFSNDSGIGFTNSISNSNEMSLPDQDVVVFSVDQRGHVCCPYCYKKFVNRYNLKVHIRDKHDSSTSNLVCVICKKTMRNMSCLRVHMYHHRKQEQKTSQGKKG